MRHLGDVIVVRLPCSLNNAYRPHSGGLAASVAASCRRRRTTDCCDRPDRCTRCAQSSVYCTQRRLRLITVSTSSSGVELAKSVSTTRRMINRPSTNCRVPPAAYTDGRRRVLASVTSQPAVLCVTSLMASVCVRPALLVFITPTLLLPYTMDLSLIHI